MVNIKLLSATIVLSIATSSAIAAEGVYVSGAATFSQALEMPSTDTYGYYQSDSTSRNTGFRLALGYSKDLNPKFGLGAELGYNNYGNDEYSTVAYYNSFPFNVYYSFSESLTYTYTAVDLLAKATWHVSTTWDLYAKLGVAHETVDISSDAGYDNSQSQSLPEVGLGLSYFATPQLSIDFAVYRIEGEDIDYIGNDNVPSIFSADLGISYYFA